MKGVARQLGISPRQLQRDIVTNVGLTPKTLQRVMRLQRFLDYASRQAGVAIEGEICSDERTTISSRSTR